MRGYRNYGQTNTALRNRQNGKDCFLDYCTVHYIREETLKQFVLQRIFAVTAVFFDDIQSFQKAVYQQRFAEAEKTVKWQKKELEQARKRIAELERIFKRIYEDDINGTISQSRF